MANEVAHAPNKTWELSLYELHRTPQEAITDNTEIAVSPRSLHSELMCPICLDMLKSTMTTKECLHRFCQDCIITALRSGNKECPTCRKKLVSKRSLRPDPNFDALISKIYPSREEYEEHQERVLAKLNQHHNTAALRQSIEEGLRLQSLNRAQRVRKHASDGTTTPIDGEGEVDGVENENHHDDLQDESASNDTTPRKRFRPYSDDSSTENSMGETSIPENAPEATPAVSEIELVFRPHPQEVDGDVPGQTRYIKTTANATVDHLSKYLAIRLSLDAQNMENAGASAEDKYTIYIASQPGVLTSLNGSMPLEQVNEKYWRVNKPLEMFYRLQSRPGEPSQLKIGAGDK
ncbi:hypothetical protein C0Q70_01164 [Pomacea canaliculata]|uniref:RING-type E3 ubiquitin transferase n=1 Tax=Pomacea canaliculata TaxID=400727 RepID=A0A2T7PYS0_POMCA|nr:hypothetical protein C0Q70_01164 [Pomacea canaliculata]